jgi:hypothetical protein
LDIDDVSTLSNEDEDDSKGSNVEILDGGSDIDICEEEAELEIFSRMLYKAQKKALTKEKAKTTSEITGGTKKERVTYHVTRIVL